MLALLRYGQAHIDHKHINLRAASVNETANELLRALSPIHVQLSKYTRYAEENCNLI